MSIYTFDLECPRCGARQLQQVDKYDEAARLNCGDCLIKNVEVVEMKIVAVTVDPEGKDE